MNRNLFFLTTLFLISPLNTKQFNSMQQAFTFDDVLLVPQYSDILPHEISLQTKIAQNISLNIPLLSAAMDTVTEAEFAIALAREGGIGIIHKNMSIEEQAAQVKKVKKFETGIIEHPITVSPKTSVKNLIELSKKHAISGVPVVENNQLVGIVTHRDIRFETNLDQPVSQVMTKKNDLITAKEHTSYDQMLELLHTNKIEKLLIVNDSFELRGMLTVKDIQQKKEKPNACKDNLERLRVGAAVGVTPENKNRVRALIKADVDILVVDTAHGHSKNVIRMVQWIKNNFPHIQIIAGNIATGKAALDLVRAGADAVKVGIGPGSICTTRVVTGIGVPQISAIAEVATALKDLNIPIIADGGIRFSGDITKALAAGASAVMIGSLFAGSEESPGQVELYHGRLYKSYRGMGSLGAMNQKYNSQDRYRQKTTDSKKLVPEGIEGRIPFKGKLEGIVEQLMGGLRSGMAYCGCKTISELQRNAQFIQITSAGVSESHPHDVHITKEAPNYQRN